MRGRIGAGLLLVLFMLLLAGCAGDMTADAVEEGRVLLWHTWSSSEEQTLNELLTNFNEVYPQIQVISISYTPEELKESFVEAAKRGLGPDIIIGSQLWIPELVDAHLIQAVDETDVDLNAYLTPALDTLRYQDALYGLPLSVETSALYTNKRLAEEPPQTLDALLEAAVEGQKVAINSKFEAAFWGVQAFGGRLLDDEGRVVLNQGGFANWLDWLAEAANVPNIILSKDEAMLNDLFAQGEVAYYVGQSSELAALQEALGEEAVGVSPLPAGPNDSAGPFLLSEPILFSNDSSPAQHERAMLLVEYLGHVEQQRILAQETGRVPANPQARIDRRIAPAVAGFVDQSKTAIPMLLLPQVFSTIDEGQETYLQVLQGLVAPGEAAEALTRQVNDSHGLDVVDAAMNPACGTAGTVEVWHAWPGAEAHALELIGRGYAQECPGISVRLKAFEGEDLVSRYRQAVQAGEGPDLLLISSEEATRLASAELVEDITDQIPPDYLQRYLPAVPEALRFEGKLYGLPLTMETMALYYNQLMVPDPPLDLGDLLSQVGPERQFAMAYSPFYAAHWGLPAFAGRLFTVEGDLAISDGGFQEWLEWLAQADDQPGIVVTRDPRTPRELFARGEAAFFVGERKLLPELQAQLGANAVRVTPLPAGPEGAAGPILEVQGLMVNPDSDQTEAAVAFAKFAASAESQRLLMAEASLAPAYVNVADDLDYPAIAGFVAQAGTAVVLPNRAQEDTFAQVGDIIYERVLADDADPAAVLQSFSDFFHEVHQTAGHETAEQCTREGQLALWHSLEGKAFAALEQSIAGFARRCPGIRVEARFVPADRLPRELAAASADGAPPDLFLAPHDLVAPLSAERLIKPVTPFVDGSMLIPYLPRAVAALRHKGELYGLPHAVETTVLYTNGDRAAQPAAQLEGLFEQASSTTPLAFDSRFRHAFWGAVLFGGELYAAGEGGGEPALDFGRMTLDNWLQWLQGQRARDGVIFDSGPEQLQEMFAAGKVTYLITGSDALPQLRAAMGGREGGGSSLGVATLPDGPVGRAAPFLSVDGFLFSAATGEEQTRTALAFAEYATALTSQVQLMETAEMAPANVLALTQVDDPALRGVLAQAQTAVILPPRPQQMVLQAGGDELLKNVLQDGLPPGEAVAAFLAHVAQTPPPAIVAYAGESVLLCEDQGHLTLWHSWPWADHGEQGQHNNALQTIVAEFNLLCPQIMVETLYVPPDEMQERVRAAVARGEGPDLFLAEDAVMAPLVESGAIQPVGGQINSEDLAHFMPQALQALRYEDALYGLPQALEVTALYYNSGAVTTTPSTLAALLAEAAAGRPLAIETSFEEAYWGSGAFGEPLFTAEGLAEGEAGGLSAWLSWLQEAQQQPGVTLSPSSSDLFERFAAGEFAYLSASSASLLPLRERMGEALRVLPLPSGPEGQASPLIRVQGFYFPAGRSEEQVALALKFAQFAASDGNQQLLAQDALLVPTRRQASDASDDPAIAMLARSAAENGVLLPRKGHAALVTAGDRAIAQVLARDADPQDAARQLAELGAGN